MNEHFTDEPNRVHSLFYPQQSAHLRLGALIYFATLLTIGTLLGKTVLGFEQSWLQLFVSLAAAVVAQILFETVDARAMGRRPRYSGGIENFISLILPSWITGLSVGILIYAGNLVTPVLFASVFSIASKFMFRVPVGGGKLHFYNPSNFGIAATLSLFPWIGLAPPYQFTENVVGIWNWIVPGVILITGVYLHGIVTRRLPLCLAWIIGFVGQALVRGFVFDTPVVPMLMPMTGAAFVLFTLYMIPDPATSPLRTGSQLMFGASVAALYGLLQSSHVEYGLFLSLVIVCSLRGSALWIEGFSQRASEKEALRTAAPIGLPSSVPVAD